MFEHTLPKISISNAVNLPDITSGNYEIFGSTGRDTGDIVITESGRKALELALTKIAKDAPLKCDVRTASGNSYISSCVTNVLNRFGTYSTNSYNKDADIILVINEFGYAAPEACFHKWTGQTIIEDCAYSMGSFINEFCGIYDADYKIFSFSKFLPFHGGGALASKIKTEAKKLKVLKLDKNQLNDWALQNTKNAKFISENIKCSQGLFFTKLHGVPEAAVIETDLDYEKLETVKKHLNSLGVENTIFYGTNSLVLPCGHSLSRNQINYIVESINAYL